MKHKIEIVYKDDAMVIVNKPPRFLTVPDRFSPNLPNLYNYLKDKLGEAYIVHRLDRETSGIICFARTKEAHKDLCHQFEKRLTKKIYLAVADGNFKEKTGVIDGRLTENPFIPGRMVVAKKGKPSVTEYEVVEEFKNYSLVEANIKTGRQHQIRVHFSHIGHPLAVDSVYNGKGAIYLSNIKRKYKNTQGEERPLMDRTTLHAYRLELSHPTTKEKMVFNAPLPKGFRALLKQLRKWGK